MKKITLLCCCAFLISGTFSVVAAEAKDIGFIKNASGQAFISRAQVMIPAKANDKLFASDNLITGDKVSLGVILQDNSVLSLGPKSRVDLSEFSFDPVGEKLSFVAKNKKVLSCT